MVGGVDFGVDGVSVDVIESNKFGDSLGGSGSSNEELTEP